MLSINILFEFKFYFMIRLKFMKFIFFFFILQVEIMKVLDLGVDFFRIIYVNLCKQNFFIKYVVKKNVEMMIFDNEDELYKVKVLFFEVK